MADNIVGGLFGMTPESLQAQRNAQLEQQASNFVNNYGDQGAMFGYKLGNTLGRGIGGMLGAQDPEMMRIKQRQQMLQGIDMNDPDSLLRAAQDANQRGDTPAAQELYNKANALAKSRADIAKTQAETTKALRETNPFQKLLEKGDYTAESIKNAEASGDIAQLVRVDKLAKPTTDFISKATEFGFGDKATYGGYTPEQVAKVNKALFEQEISKKRAGASTTVLPKGEEEFVKALGKIDAGQVEAAMASRNNAISTLNSLQELSRLDDRGLISGSFAAGRVGATNLLNTLGLASPADSNKLAQSENYAKEAGNVVLGVLGGRLGAGFSNEDRAFIQSLVPQLENSPAARRQLIEFMLKKNQVIVDEATRLEDYARENKNLKGFKPKIPLFTPPSSNRFSGLSDAELDARIKAAQGTKKNKE